MLFATYTSHIYRECESEVIDVGIRGPCDKRASWGEVYWGVTKVLAHVEGFACYKSPQ